jgi:hypothetical protein
MPAACCFVCISLQDDAAAAQWFPVEQPPSLAFDHKLIIREAFETLTHKPEVHSNGEDRPGSAWPLRDKQPMIAVAG